MNVDDIYRELKKINTYRDDYKIHYWFNKMNKDSVSEYVIIYDDIKLISIFKGGKVLKNYFIVGFNRSKKNELNKYDKQKIFVIDRDSRKNVKLLRDKIINKKRDSINYINFKIKEKL